MPPNDKIHVSKFILGIYKYNSSCCSSETYSSSTHLVGCVTEWKAKGRQIMFPTAAPRKRDDFTTILWILKSDFPRATFRLQKVPLIFRSSKNGFSIYAKRRPTIYPWTCEETCSLFRSRLLIYISAFHRATSRLHKVPLKLRTPKTIFLYMPNLSKDTQPYVHEYARKRIISFTITYEWHEEDEIGIWATNITNIDMHAHAYTDKIKPPSPIGIHARDEQRGYMLMKSVNWINSPFQEGEKGRSEGNEEQTKRKDRRTILIIWIRPIVIV